MKAVWEGYSFVNLSCHCPGSVIRCLRFYLVGVSVFKVWSVFTFVFQYLVESFSSFCLVVGSVDIPVCVFGLCLIPRIIFNCLLKVSDRFLKSLSI